jgi:hypothetical protein
MTHEIEVTRKAKVTKEELYKFLGWIVSVVPEGTKVNNVPIKGSTISAVVDKEAYCNRYQDDGTYVEFTVTYKQDAS